MVQNELERYFDRLWPITRSLTGNGNRESLTILSEIIPIEQHEVPSGTVCFDWTVPPEWNIREAWIKDSKGRIIVNFLDNNLHILGYSVPFSGTLNLTELKKHLYSLPNQPDLIPYLTSYYRERWGFCITHHQLETLQEDEYNVYIDSTLDPAGHMTVGDLLIVGETKDEVLLSTYICHPSMANNELSGPLVASFVGRELLKRKLRYSYRLVFAPETIGSIYYLSKWGEHFQKNLKAGFIITTAGDPGNFTYKRSRPSTALCDRAAEAVLRTRGEAFTVEDFFPMGSDERQYGSPGFNLPVGSLMRTRYGKYKEYHTSADNKQFISFEALEETIRVYLQVIDLIENNFRWKSIMPYCEPQLGKRGLYPDLGSQKEKDNFVETMMWVLNLSDGHHDTIDMVMKSGKPSNTVIDVLNILQQKELIIKAVC